MKLNADLGESYGHWQFDADSDIMPYIDMANIACGGHAGDPTVMQKTIELAAEHNVLIGAHPSYPDLQGFGRRSMRVPPNELMLIIQAQMATLDGLAKCQGNEVSYVKPHGALYNDMMADKAVRNAVFSAVAGFYCNLPLVVQASTENETLRIEARERDITLIFEAFSDRLYLDSGLLTPRSHPRAVLNANDAVEQARRLIQRNEVITESGAILSIYADTICVHGDTPEAMHTVKKIRELLQ
tara:strand:- start:576 stop:1301 length:726 start_codon:yes stop_codon:yes gene_type:complete